MSLAMERLEGILLQLPGSAALTWPPVEQSAVNLEAARSRAVRRLALTLHDFAEGRAGAPDVAVLLRQAIRIHNHRLRLHRIWWERLAQAADNAGLYRVEHPGEAWVDVLADAWEPEWLPGAREIDRLEVRRHDATALGSGLLYAMTGFASYQSEAQKAAVEACLFAAPGSTILATLPTGSGKSLCSLLPAWCASEGGRKRGGTTLVVVPTVALALDQERNARRFFAGAIDEAWRPRVRIGASTPVEKAEVRKAIEDGSLPLLFTSPEALLRSELREVCLDAARRGTLTRLVIDEAHLVETWGAGFRTEFQLLAAYRKTLLAASGGQLRTTLLSATISDHCAALLQHLFAEDGVFGHVQANRLRPEPSFWFSQAPDCSTRQRRVVEALYHLPRPAILYLSFPDDATWWLQRLRTLGFARVEAFTGETTGDARARLLSEWEADRIDIMVATSAFGVGVDKPDVRAIIHACLPENLDRYYQEVGRGGRDGCSSISFMCVAPDDQKAAYHMTDSALITADKAWPRWEGMHISGGRIIGTDAVLNVDAPPANRPEMRQSERNREWNEHVLLLMQRAELLSLDDARVDPALLERVSAEGVTGVTTPIGVALRQTAVLDNPVALHAVIGAQREQELSAMRKAIDDLVRLVSDYEGEPTSCIGSPLSRLYPDTALACGGCASCRRLGRPPYADPLPLTCDLPPIAPSARLLSGDLRNFMVGGVTLIVVRDGDAADGTLDELLAHLVQAGVQQIILPTALSEDEEWARALTAVLSLGRVVPHLLLSQAWLFEEDRPLFPLPTACVYPVDDGEADRVWGRLRRWRPAARGETPLIHIIPPGLRLPSMGGLFTDKVDGIPLPAWKVNNLLSHVQEEDQFLF